MSSMFGGGYRTSINGGTFNAITTYQAKGPTITGFDRLLQAVAPNAFHNSDDRPDPPKCHENTRVAVINKIMDWVIDTDTFILWLYGPAGAGKTAIARSVAELCEAQGLLLASFLFFRSDSMRNTMKPLVANIAYCLSCVIPSARERIEAVIEANPLVLSYSIAAQLTKLVLEPLRILVDQGYRFPQLIVIDGLDECLDKDAQTNLIGLLSSSVARSQLPLKFLVVSRPEAHIKLAITLASERSTITHLELNNEFQPDEDIHHFLTDRFHEIRRCHPLRSQIPPLWPSTQQLNTLVRKASGQFIYAALVMRFIHSACNLPQQQLDIVLGLRPAVDHDLPFAELDTLYKFILSCAKNLDLVLRILGVNDALLDKDSDRGIGIIQSVLGLEDGEVRVYLITLSSLLEVQRNNEIVFYHSSFMDFLRTPERSADYCLDDIAKSHSLIMQWVLQAFTDIGPNVACRQSIEKQQSRMSNLGMDFPSHLTFSLWTPELEHAIERFSLSIYLDWYDRLTESSRRYLMEPDFPETFLKYLKDKEKPELYRHNAALYLECGTSSIDNHYSCEKFHLLSTVWFALRKPLSLTSRKRIFYPEKWHRFCATLFGFNVTDIDWDRQHCNLMRDPSEYAGAPVGAIFGDIAETTRLVPEPILSRRLARVAISCMRYLYCHDSNTHSMRDHLLAWVVKSKRSPWLWRRRMLVISTKRRLFREHRTYRYTFPQSLWRSRRILYSSEGIQSEELSQKQHIFYIWSLDLLYHTLRKAIKSDKLTRALSKPFFPSSALLIHPRRIKRVQKAVAAYLEKFRV